MFDRIKVEFVTLSSSNDLAGVYFVILAAEDDGRRVAIMVTKKEADIIKDTLTERSSAHKEQIITMLELMRKFDIEIDEIVLHAFDSDDYRAYMLTSQLGAVQSVRMSVANGILVSAITNEGMYMDRTAFEQLRESVGNDKVSFSIRKLEDYALRNLLEIAVSNEDYELASAVRDELKRRK